jgi:hypothetical protein
MPFSSDGDTIDFIYGVINWKKAVHFPAAIEVEAASDFEPEPIEQAAEPGNPATAAMPVGADTSLDQFPDIALGEEAGLADRLSAARECAATARSSEGRSRDALYRALDFAYDFALASKESPDDYADLLEESGVRAQARAPMTPVVKLVFGIDYDKARLTEYAAALSYADRQGVGFGGFLAFIVAQVGGLKTLVAAERLARRPEPKADTKTQQGRERLRSAGPLSLASIRSEEEFALVLTHRAAGGHHEAVAVVDDPVLVERAIRRIAT